MRTLRSLIILGQWFMGAFWTCSAKTTTPEYVQQAQSDSSANVRVGIRGPKLDKASRPPGSPLSQSLHPCHDPNLPSIFGNSCTASASSNYFSLRGNRIRNLSCISRFRCHSSPRAFLLSRVFASRQCGSRWNNVFLPPRVLSSISCRQAVAGGSSARVCKEAV